MPRVLVFGATGYLGQAATQALVRSGLHTVYGLCRSASKAQSLTASEIILVMCEDPLNAVRSFRIDAVVDCTATYGDSAQFLADIKKVGTKEVAAPPKISFIYISGAWVHGNSDGPVTDMDPVGAKSAPTQPLHLVAWRPELERKVLAA
ncbi:uncharacterized protein Z519_00514 [Cladophialophora bantiana CBS 173.52]|uniref:NAD-dependent epimerase/dehydratase domain-containing protein n=1 Tax=Cladophialophora bantiana (strain ATCC 10958 / CBS 173.52 / CDC B-1940 / NIH 8579) TaxID=1442370 RepID=A0A0D2F9V0_CLAB1|nr:uncharacterized protein Z519_00514 [Cladophialophora bantiana CBS 173.52]KIW98851.1 hypothetical protein Z519_00514 [Cladophialophora bantiana CBS 173.52]